MQIKIDTKEKFHIITLQVDPAAVTLTAEMVLSLQEQLHYSVKNVILNMSAVQDIDLNVAEQLVAVQQTFYEQNASFVICALSKKVEEKLDEAGLLELMNVTPTESEAYDIVQMEEIEREFE